MKTYASASEGEREEICKSPRYYLHLPDLPVDLIMQVLYVNPGAYGEVYKPSREVNLLFASQHGYCLGYINKLDQDEEICIEAIRGYCYAISGVHIGVTESMAREAILSLFRNEVEPHREFGKGFIFMHIPDEILESASFRRFLIDHGIFKFSVG